MKTKRRNQVAVFLGFALCILGGGLLGAWLGSWSEFDLPLYLVLTITFSWGVMAMFACQLVYGDLEIRRKDREHRARMHAELDRIEQGFWSRR